MTKRLLSGSILAASLTLGCAVRTPVYGPANPPDHAPAHGVRHGGGPPPHAPAHGYRAKIRNRDLRFDAGIGAYVVADLPGVYWHSGWFYRLIRDRWLRSLDGDGPWNDARWGDVPVGLRGGKAKGQGKGRGQAHGRDR